MRREEVQVALEAACAISHHHEFVIAGSLSVLGKMDIPPDIMSMSIDIDFYPLRDPGRANEIAAALGEDSAFHERNGYYLDPISPELPVLPAGWRDRLVAVKLGEVTAYFLDVNDTAVSKYARGAPNDYRWLEAGLESKILDIDIIASRVRFSTQFHEDEDKRKTLNGLAMHRMAMRADGSLDKDMLSFLASNPPAQIRTVDTEDGQYVGSILWVNESVAIQSLGRGDIAIHDIHSWDIKPTVKDAATISYHDGIGGLNIKPPERDHNSPSFGR